MKKSRKSILRAVRPVYGDVLHDFEFAVGFSSSVSEKLFTRDFISFRSKEYCFSGRSLAFPSEPEDENAIVAGALYKAVSKYAFMFLGLLALLLTDLIT